MKWIIPSRVVLSRLCCVISIAVFTLHLEACTQPLKMDPYKVLELPLGSNHTMIRRQYQVLSAQHDPGVSFRNGCDDERVVAQAYEILTNEVSWRQRVGDSAASANLLVLLKGQIALLVAILFCVAKGVYIVVLGRTTADLPFKTKSLAERSMDTIDHDAGWSLVEKPKENVDMIECSSEKLRVKGPNLPGPGVALAAALSSTRQAWAWIKLDIARFTPVLLSRIFFVITIAVFALHLQSHLVPPRLDPYSVLEIPIGSNSTVIKQQYRKLSLRYHPESFVDHHHEQYCRQHFQRVQDAYDMFWRHGDYWRNWVQYGDPTGPSRLALYFRGNISLLVAAVPFVFYLSVYENLLHRSHRQVPYKSTTQQRNVNVGNDVAWISLDKPKEN